MARKFTTSLTVPLAHPQVQQLKQMADEDGRSVSETIRRLLLSAIRRRSRERADEFETNGKK